MNRKIDDLSHSLDELNSGRQPKHADTETAKLIAVATLVKKAALTSSPPKHLLKSMTQRAADGLAASRTASRRAWLFSGALSTAAAVLLVVGMQLWTPAQKDIDVTQTSPPAIIPTASQPPASSTSPVATPRPAAEKTETTPASQIPAPVATPPVPSPEDRPAAARAGAGSIPPSPQSETATTGLIPSRLVALHLPGRSPDSIVTDKAAGTIRQVYATGTPQEIIIVQRIKPSAAKAAPSQAKAGALREVDANKSVPVADSLTIVKVTIDGQEVTLEGRQTRQELLDIAKTLEP